MSLKTDYFDGASGFNQQMSDVFDQGEAFVTTNLSALTAELQTNAAKGLQAFKVSIQTTFEPQNLRLKGYHLKTYLAGIQSGLAAEEIYPHECILALNTEDTMETKIDFQFNL